MNYSTRLLSLLLIAAFALSACGGTSDNPPPRTIAVTFPVLPQATLLATCATSELENWYEVTSTLLDTFMTESELALDRPPAEIPTLTNRLIDLRNAIAVHLVPNCVTDLHMHIIAALQDLLDAFQRYANGDSTADEMREQMTLVRSQIEAELAPWLAQIELGLEERLDIERETPMPEVG